MTGSILKRERGNDRMGLAWLRCVLDPEALGSVKEMMVGETTTFRYFGVQRLEQGWRVSPTLTPEISNVLSQWLPVLDKEDALAWVEMQAPSTIEATRNSDRALMRVLYGDILWVRHVYLMQRYSGLANTFVNYLQTSTQWSRSQVMTERTYKRASFLEVSKMALLYDKDSNVVQRPMQVKKIKALVDSMPWLKSLEVQEGFDSSKLTVLLTDMQLTLTRLNVPANKRFDLRFRKIRRTKKTGMYVPTLQLLIVDPRETHSLWHELAHWLEDTGVVQLEWDRVVDADIKERYPKGRWEKEMRARLIERRLHVLNA